MRFSGAVRCAAVVVCTIPGVTRAGDVETVCLQGGGRFSLGNQPPLGIQLVDGGSTVDFTLHATATVEDLDPDENVGFFELPDDANFEVTICNPPATPGDEGLCTLYTVTEGSVRAASAEEQGRLEIRGVIAKELDLFVTLRNCAGGFTRHNTLGGVFSDAQTAMRSDANHCDVAAIVVQPFSPDVDLVLTANAELERLSSSCEETPTILFARGDANDDGDLAQLSDAIFLLEYRMRSGPAPACSYAADANGDDRVNIADGIYILLFTFTPVGKPPPPPYPECGTTEVPGPSGCTEGSAGCR